MAQVAERLGQPPADHQRVRQVHVRPACRARGRRPCAGRRRATRAPAPCARRPCARFASVSASRLAHRAAVAGQHELHVELVHHVEAGQELARRVGRVAEVVVERHAAEQVVARQQQAALGLVQHHVRRRVTGRLVDLPRAEVGVDLHPWQQLAVRHDDLGDAEPVPRRASRSAASVSAGTPLWRAISKRRSKARSGSSAAFVMCAWFGCIHSCGPLRSMIGAARP